jgi:hypothetical protein
MKKKMLKKAPKKGMGNKAPAKAVAGRRAKYTVSQIGGGGGGGPKPPRP